MPRIQFFTPAGDEIGVYECAMIPSEGDHIVLKGMQAVQAVVGPYQGIRSASSTLRASLAMTAKNIAGPVPEGVQPYDPTRPGVTRQEDPIGETDEGVVVIDPQDAE